MWGIPEDMAHERPKLHIKAHTDRATKGTYGYDTWTHKIHQDISHILTEHEESGEY